MGGSAVGLQVRSRWVSPGTVTAMDVGAHEREGLTIRRAAVADRARIIQLCRASLGWGPDDPNEALFAWKHDENPFGASPVWVAETGDGEIAGLRVFLRWQFRTPEGTVLRAVRAVDTATHPDHRGKGIFTKLTLGAIPDLEDDGVDLIFNTPNDKSRPGYLKMGWSEVGRVPVGVRLASATSIPRVLRARTAAELWSRPSELGENAPDVLADTTAVERLLERCGAAPRIATDRTAAYLRWRYRFPPLRYRAVLVGRSIEEGLVILRLRGRGPALEVAVCEVLAPDPAMIRPSIRRIVDETAADHLLRCGGPAMVRDGFVRAPQLGPILTWRPICRSGVPAMKDLSLTFGDIELF